MYAFKGGKILMKVTFAKKSRHIFSGIATGKIESKIGIMKPQSCINSTRQIF
jgi:hypothetical protein